MGKTSLATNVAFNVARRYRPGEDDGPDAPTRAGGVVGFFSLEMSSEQLANRILAAEAQVRSDMLLRGDLEEEDFVRFVKVAQELQEVPLYIDDTPALAISTLAARARRLKRMHGLHLLVVDYIQLVRPARGISREENRVQELSGITQGLKALAKELDVPVIALSQLSRQVEAREDKRPQLSDLRESGSIEQDADVVMFVFRQEYYHSRAKPDEDDPRFPEWQDRAEKLARPRRGHHRQAASRPDRIGGAAFRGPAHALLRPRPHAGTARGRLRGLPVSLAGRLTVDLGAVVENWRALARRAAGAEPAAVVKADGYGCGIAPVGRALADAGARVFFVAQPGEGAALRAAARARPGDLCAGRLPPARGRGARREGAGPPPSPARPIDRTAAGLRPRRTPRARPHSSPRPACAPC